LRRKSRNERGREKNGKKTKKKEEAERKKKKEKEEEEEILDVRGKSWAAESNVSRRAKGVLASKTNSYPQSPLSAVFFADNLLLAA
jgi:hypothetical protein